MNCLGYVSVVKDGQEMLLREDDPALVPLRVRESFELMPCYTDAERSARRNLINNRIDVMVDKTWAAEKETRRVEHESLKRSLGKKKKAPRRKYDIPDKEAWRKHYGEAFREMIETDLPKLLADDFKHPLLHIACMDVIEQAEQMGVPEDIREQFIELLIDTRKISSEAAEKLFKVIARNPQRLNDCFSCPMIEAGKPIPAIEISPRMQWLRDFMKVDIKTVGATRGKGELGATLLFRGLRLDPKGDLITVNGLRIEMKSISKVSKEIRLGSSMTYSDGETFKKISDDEGLRRPHTQLMKWITWPIINKNSKELSAVFGSVDAVKKSLDEDIKKAIDGSDISFWIYDEELETVTGLDTELINWRGVTKEGRWKFELKQNKAPDAV